MLLLRSPVGSERAERRPLNAPSSHVDARLADLDQLTDEERATITNVIDALVTDHSPSERHQVSSTSADSISSVNERT